MIMYQYLLFLSSCYLLLLLFLFFSFYGDHRYLYVLTHTFPTRRSSGLLVLAMREGAPDNVKGISLFIVPKFLVNDDGSLGARNGVRSEEHTSELQSLMRISYAVFCLTKKNKNKQLKTIKK